MIPTLAQLAHFGGWIVIGVAGIAISVVAFTPLFWPEPVKHTSDDFAESLEAELSGRTDGNAGVNHGPGVASAFLADGARHTSARPVNARGVNQRRLGEAAIIKLEGRKAPKGERA